MRKYIYNAIILCVLITLNMLIGCSNSPKRNLIFPSEYSFVNFDEDTLVADNNCKPIKIVVWADSVGCTGCKLQLDTWQYSLKELNDKFPEQIGYLFFLQFKEEDDMKFFLGLEEFEDEYIEADDSVSTDDDFFQIKFPYPVVWDREGVFGKLNNSSGYTCYVIADNNMILFMGDPPFTPEILEKYESVIKNYFSKNLK